LLFQYSINRIKAIFFKCFTIIPQAIFKIDGL
jgi:hypothetical protein